MRIAVISDIHGNIAALDAVLADIETRSVDTTLNLGDILSGPLYPAETAERLMALSLPTIKGNHERQLLTQDPDKMGLSDQYAAAVLSSCQRAWLDSLPTELRLNDDVMMVHGTADSDLEYFLETVTPTGVRAATLDEVTARAGDVSAKVILCGHTHVPRIVTLRDGRMIVTPGSVGLPAYTDERPYPHAIETGSPQARYALIEKGSDGWSAELIGIDYDWETAAQRAERNHRPVWACALRTGYVG